MPIRDRNIDRLREFLYIPETAFSGIIGLTTGTDASVHTGVAVRQEVNTTGDAGLLMDTAADLVIGRVHMPFFDPNFDIGVRVHWSTESLTAADTITWLVTYDRNAENDTIIVPATALDTVIAQDTATGTAGQDQFTARGKINAKKFAPTIWSSDDGVTPVLQMWRWMVELDAFAAGLTEDKFFLGLLLDFVPRYTKGGGAKRRADYL